MAQSVAVTATDMKLIRRRSAELGEILISFY